MQQKSKTTPASDMVVEAEVIDEVRPQPPPGEPGGFIGTDTLLTRVPVSRGTLMSWRKAGKIPWVRLTGRRVLWHWPSVEQALLRMQRGGGE